MTSNTAIVDDRSLRVTYGGSWVEGGSPNEFNGTTKYTTQQGSTASFTFFGTSVTVFGTTAAYSDPQSSMDFLVDDSIRGTYTPASDLGADTHHSVFYTSPTLSEGPHTLTMTQTAAQENGVIFLDYIMYNTSRAADVFFVDDRDSRITYSPPWTFFGSDEDFMHTSQASPGKGATLTLPFQGRGISFYGGINNGSAALGQVLNASMTIDGGPPTFFVPPTQTAAVTTNDLYFNSGVLANGNHTLVVTAENEHTVWADYFLIVPPPATSSSGSGSATNTANASSQIGKSKSKSAVGPGVGGAIGGVILVGLLVAVVVLCLRRRRRKQAGDYPLDLQPGSPPSMQVTPFSDYPPVGPSGGWSTQPSSSVRSQPHFDPATLHQSHSQSNLSSTSYPTTPSVPSPPMPMPMPMPMPPKLATEARYNQQSLSTSPPSTIAGTRPGPGPSTTYSGSGSGSVAGSGSGVLVEHAEAPPMYTA
ncbi:hypothetical protein C8F01DRAFT_1369512 [Mycena amicta]|nr:hypothetical protein C8F01DRAFT_1369512 [Mycena amicta]